MDTARLELPATPAAASVARLFVRCLCEEWGVAGVADVAELLSSELVTNAVIHARSAIELEAVKTHSSLRVDVRDVGPGSITAAVLPPPSEAEGGRGLGIVASLADTWGVDDTGHGKSVWFTLATPHGDDSQARGRRGAGRGQMANRAVEPSVASDA
jgi:anti-sigma regulatory factor (Ser/Thr protein kinase)